MGAVLGAGIDLLHAVLMTAWIVGLPLLFWRHWPRWTRAYAVYAIAFIVVNQISFALLGECFLTTLARACWQQSRPSAIVSGEWFTVRLAQTVFHLTPSHRAVKLASEGLILVTAIGIILRGGARHAATRSSAKPEPDARNLDLTVPAER